MEVFSIIVAVQNGLDEIKTGLRELGHNVVDVESYNYPIDAIVYEGNCFQISHISTNNMPEVVMGKRVNYGVFIINATGKSIGQIDEMLKMRCYEHLF